MSYPGITLDSDGNNVEGFIFSSNELDKKFAMLDDFEGEEYERTLTKARLANGEFTDAYVYALK